MPSGARKNEWYRLVRMGTSLERCAEESTSTIAVRISTPLLSPVSPSISSSSMVPRSVRSKRRSQRLTSFAADDSPKRTFPNPIRGDSPSSLATTSSGAPPDASALRMSSTFAFSGSESSLRSSAQVSRESVPHGFSSRASWG